MAQSLETIALKARVKALLSRVSVHAFRRLYGAEERFLPFCRLLEIRVKKTGIEQDVRLNPTKIQLDYCGRRSPRDVLLKPRQVRITTIELARDVWFWLTKRGVNVRIVCQSSSKNEMVNELSERVQLMLESLRRNAGLQIELAAEAKDSWVLADGGGTLKIIGAGASMKAADKKGRGAPIHRLHTTEIAFWEYAGATMSAIRGAIPKVEEGSEVVHESTANGSAGESRDGAENAAGGPTFYWLYQDAKKRRTQFQAVFFSWMDEPEYQLPLDPGEVLSPETQPDRDKAERERQIVALGASPEQLKWYRAQVAELGQHKTDQEFPSDDETCFLVSGRMFFDKAKVGAMLAAAKAPSAPAPIEVTEIRRPGAVGQLRIWHLPRFGYRYIVSADTSEGTGGDGAGGHVYEVGTGRHMATLSGQFKPDELAVDLDMLGRRYTDERSKLPAVIAVERNNHGHACLAVLCNSRLEDGVKVPPYPNIFQDKDGHDGWYNVQAKRTAALDALDAAVRKGEWTSPDSEVIGEFLKFVVSKEGKAEAEHGSTDDHVIMAMIGWDVLTHHRPVPQVAMSPPRRPDLRPRFGADRGYG